MQRFLFIFCLLVLAACSSGNSSKQYEIGLDPSWYPLELPGRASNVTAFTNELLQEIAGKEKITLSKIDKNFDNLVLGLKKEKYDAILSSKQPYIFYEKKYDFSDPFLITGPVLVMPASSDVHSLDALSGKEIAVQDASSAALIMEKYPGLLMRTYDSIPAALSDLVAGRIDGAVINILSAEAYTHDLYQGKLKIVTAPLNNEGLRLITLHDHAPELIDAFNEGLKKLKSSGKYNEMARKWGLAEN